MQNPPSKSEKPGARSPARHPVRIDPVLVEQLAQIVARLNLTEIEVNQGDLRIRVARTAQLPASPNPAPATVPAASIAASTSLAPVEHPGTVKSPMVGTVYRRPSPEAKPFVEVGSPVKAGEKVLLIEAMKTFNEILAPRNGNVAAILIEDGQPVEYGEPLLVIE